MFPDLKENKKKYLRRLSMAVLIVGVAVLQGTPHLLPRIGLASAAPVLVLVLCSAMFDAELPAAFLGLAGGLLWDANAMRGEGYHAIFLFLAGFAVSFLMRHFMRNNFLSALVLCLAGTALHDVLYWLFFFVFTGVEGAGHLFVFSTLPGIVYTVAFTPIFYFFVRFIARSLPDPDVER